MAQLSTSEPYFIDISAYGSLRTRTCDTCRKPCLRTRAPWYRCIICPNFGVCNECFQARQFEHENHGFDEVNVEYLIKHNLTRKGDWMRYVIQPDTKCFTCLDNQPNAGQREWRSLHGFFMSDLKRSGSKGCQLCSLVYRGLSTALPSAVSENPGVDMVVGPKHIRVSLNGSRAYQTDCMLIDQWQWYFYALPGVESPWPSVDVAPEYESEFSSAKCFDQLRAWINKCDTQHPHLHCSGADKSMPRRLLSLSSGTDGLSLRLQEVPDSSFGRYIALSHCWGALPTLRTLSTNIIEMRQSIALEDLPKTFKDAVYCAQQLDIEFIWIDSLCIIQDDALDWQIESSKMEQYYSKAWLVIIAAAAGGDTEGFLGSRPAIYQGIPLQTVEASGEFDMCIRHVFPHIQGDASSDADMQGSFTSLRGWCLQETILARRSVSFHASEMVWECHTSINCQCGRKLPLSGTFDLDRLKRKYEPIEPFHYIPSVLGTGSRFTYPVDRWRYIGKPFTRRLTRAAMSEEWRALTVPLYTQRQLTKRSDKLPALAGIAALLGSWDMGCYMAGIWKEDAQLGLLWNIKAREERPALSDPPAPSFSWASIDQRVEYKLPGYAAHAALESEKFLYGDVNIRVMNVAMQLESSSPYGAVSGGNITLSGLISHSYLSLHDGKFNLEPMVDCKTVQTHYTRAYGKRDLFFPDTFLQAAVLQGKDKSLMTTVRRSQKARSEQQDFTSEVDCLIVANIRTPVRDPRGIFGVPPDTQEYALLVLGKIECSGDIWIYERLGMAVFLFKPDIGTAWLEKAEEREIIIR
ncbi:HET-domain-containing protein [Byssothecium circinans]|uniref:HET-domain-containing protein n=1 Tax=Byssothecium circinans TaxID=147558 RepID=A0A6A5TDW0_9PLEO|nr:HET-domain-containing protein [Byssothecium circinans]